MSKRIRKANYEKYIKEGRGQGELEKYKPWITIQDIPSKGRVSRIKGITTNRQHEFLSDLERNYFYYLDFADNVVDIKEQYPLLPIEETIQIANELGIEHPKNPVTKEPVVMTTDFMIIFRNDCGELEERARTVKYKDELMDRRVIEKFDIEREFYKRHEIDWYIVTEEYINKEYCMTLADLYSYISLSNVDGFDKFSNLELDEIVRIFISNSLDYDGTYRMYCNYFDNAFKLKLGSGISILKHSIINKFIKTDITSGLNLDQALNIVKIDEDELEMRYRA